VKIVEDDPAPPAAPPVPAPPPYQSKLYIRPDCPICIDAPMPGLWFRFWARVLLGFRWKAREQ